MIRNNQTYLGQVIDVKLIGKYETSGYSVLCCYKYIASKDKYKLSMWLHKNDNDDLLPIAAQKIDSQLISGTKETIRDNIERIVNQMCIGSYFDSFIEKFEYTYKYCKFCKDALDGKSDVTED